MCRSIDFSRDLWTPVYSADIYDINLGPRGKFTPKSPEIANNREVLLWTNWILWNKMYSILFLFISLGISK